MQKLSKPGARLFVDDMERKDLHADIDRAAAEGIILKPVCHRSGFGKHTYCFSSYL